jgi:large subunit ribosomal protein L4
MSPADDKTATGEEPGQDAAEQAAAATGSAADQAVVPAEDAEGTGSQVEEAAAPAADAEPEPAVADEPAPAKPARRRAAASKPDDAADDAAGGEAAQPARPAAKEAAPDKADTDKAGTAKAGTAKAGVAKAGVAKAGTAKAGTAKDGAAKDGAKAGTGKAKVVADGGNPATMDDLPADIFDAKVNIPLMHQVVVAQQAAARQGTHATKTRGDVRGGGKKPYRQKGTGRARQGSTRAPQFAGGGVVHGPVPRSYAQKTPKKMKAAALRGALSDRARHGLVYVADGFVDGDQPKTAEALSALNVLTGTMPATASMLVVAESSDKVTWKSLRNCPGVHLIDPGQLNTYDVLVSDRVVFTSTALASFVARAGRSGRAGGEGQ